MLFKINNYRNNAEKVPVKNVKLSTIYWSHI